MSSPVNDKTPRTPCPISISKLLTKPYLDANELIINMGPQHPATHGVLRVKLKLDGEKSSGHRVRHRIPAPRRGKDRREPHLCEFTPYVDRMDYCAAVTNGHGLLRSSRKAAGRGRLRRARSTFAMILTELQRIASHLLWLGTHALDIGAMTPLFTPSASGKRSSRSSRSTAARA